MIAFDYNLQLYSTMTINEIIILKILMESTIDSNLTLTGTINECVILNNAFTDIQKEGGGNNKAIPVIKEDLSMDIGNGIYINGDTYERKYGIEVIEGESAYIHNKNMLNIGCANNREMGLLFDFNTLPNTMISTDTARISFYKALITGDTGTVTMKDDVSTLEIAVADNSIIGNTDYAHSAGDRIVVRKYYEGGTHMINPATGEKVDESPRPFSKERWDQYAMIVSELALIDYDGKTKIGANKLVVGDIDVYKLLMDLANKNGLNINDYRTTGFISDYKDIEPTFKENIVQTNYRVIENAYDENIGK